MNLCFLTVQIATWPQRYVSKKGKLFTHFFIRVPNPKKGRSSFYINATARGETGKHLFYWYEPGDYIIIEGRINLQTDQKKKYHVEVDIVRESPVGLEI
jgi:hypothetical protein